MDRAKFYAELRKRDSGVFGTSLSQRQVDGTENLLDVAERYFPDQPLDHLAYNLGTAYLETAHTMQPITERGPRSYFDKYEPGTRIGKVLGNTLKGDGYRFRGEGHVQNTGRANAHKATERLNEMFGLNLDLVASPSQRGDPLVSALSLFLGNKEGWWTTRKLSDYSNFKDMRRVVNGTDRAGDIADYARAFRTALIAAGYGASHPAPQPQEPIPPLPVPPKEPSARPEPTVSKSGGINWFAVIAFAAFMAAVAYMIFFHRF